MPQCVSKTIEIKCPESSAQSRRKTEAPPSSPRLNRRKSRMNSYSTQSWLDTEKKAAGKVKPMRPVVSQPIPNRCPYRRAPSEFGGARRSSRPPPARRPDPSAPHLKYGLFANPRKPVIIGRGLAKDISSKATLKKKVTSTEISARRKEQQRIPKEDYEQPDQQLNDAPLFVFRPISHRYTQKLSASDIQHLDIEPGRRMISSSQLPRITIM